MRLHLLGPLELWAGDRRFDLGQPRQRAVLASLAVDAGRLVTVDNLVDRVWDDTPPDGARSALYAHISRLRRTLQEAADADAGQTAPPPVPDRSPLSIRRASGGYILEADERDIDVTMFRALVSQAREEHLEDAHRGRLLTEALDLWRGVPLSGLTGAWAERVRTVWTQECIEATAAWARIQLRLGRAEEVVARVRPVLAEHSLAEPLAVVMIRALAASDRIAEALGTYADVRQRLADALGVDPGDELHAAHQELLRAQSEARPGEGTAATAAAPPPARGPVPEQLPASIRAFTGRDEQLAELTRHLTAGDTEAGDADTVVISAVSGTAGVGKTALAVHWAHRMRHAFPDGRLYVNLRGYDPEKPVSAATALSGFLAALGVPGPEIPARIDDRAARYRTAVSGRRMLIVLDNASSAEQIRPLLPGTPTCKVVVTSRDSLAPLVSLHGAHRLLLDVLSPDDALALLRTLVGDRVDAERADAVTLAEQCGRLPLALRVAAELVLFRPQVPLAELVTELRDFRRRLDLLDSDGDPRAAVRAVFSWSYERLPDPAARLFRLLGLHPGPDFGAHAAAALSGEPVDRVRRALNILIRAHLVQQTRPGRYTMHDLLRAYAADQSETHDGPGDRAEALSRLLDHCLAAAAAAMDVLYPAERHLRPPVPAFDTVLPPLRTAAESQEWLRAEQPTLVALCARTEYSGSAENTVRLAMTLHRHYERSGRYADALAVHGHALRAARQAGDARGEADVLVCIGAVHRRLSDYETSRENHEASLAICRRTGYQVGEARNLTNLGVLHELQGQYPQAAECHTQAVVLFRSAGDRQGEADVLNNLGIVHELLEDFDASMNDYRQALALYRELGHTTGEAGALGNLGITLSRLGEHAAAAGHFERALDAFRRLGHPSGEAHALTNLGDALCGMGRHEEAAERQRQALALFRQTKERYGEAGARNGIGEALHGMGRHTEALEAHASALSVALEINEQEEQARAQIGTARVQETLGDPGRARTHWQQALDLYTALGSPRAEDVRKQLSGLGDG
ncbi:AfsR/SARP family transcriptional regulator [Streptomyces cavernae]|uniref:AfsR/SARP family transcriptional regulator n=1 Tax=Streptomyces cavernae TaxID=2259034 RepID=UPI000FEBEE05|nr:tetratricopeptide repeat protein [Streptomyces cavernae]